MNLSELLNFDHLFSSPLSLSRFLPRKKTVESPPQTIPELSPNIDQKIKEISELSKKVYDTVIKIGKKPCGNTWSEMRFQDEEYIYWFQADKTGILVVNSYPCPNSSCQDTHNLVIQTNNLLKPIFSSEIINHKNLLLKNEQNIPDPDHYNLEGLCKSYDLLSKLKLCPRILVGPDDVFSPRIKKKVNSI